ncbi:MAG: nucleotide-binding protein [Thermodesulfovibrionales bacterium]|nr:nucleotide-binding protein [Thermodesulfovibrionales bacterium]
MKRPPKKKSLDKKENFTPSQQRKYISQSDIPSYPLDEALRIPKTIVENYASQPTTPLHVAKALNMSPSYSSFRMLCGAAIAYELTDGGYSAPKITVTPLGKRIVQPEEGDDLVAKREAILKPRVLGEFLNKYSGYPLPQHNIALNVLEEMGVPREKAESVYTLILDGAQAVNFIQEIKGKRYIDLSGVPVAEEKVEEKKEENSAEESPAKKALFPHEAQATSSQTNRRVFITHGKNKDLIEPIKKLLGFGEMIPVVSVEKQAVAKPVPDKVMDDMRSCGAAIIHVDAEQKLIDKEANEQNIINPNVLIEIGAAMALYGRRFILLVREGVQLPSNLQGLYTVRYNSETLDGNATIKLLEAINDIKNNPIPERDTKTA